jgi:hypothetical protein
MKKIQLLILILLISSPIYAFDFLYKDLDQYMGCGIGYTSTYVYQYGRIAHVRGSNFSLKFGREKRNTENFLYSGSIQILVPKVSIKDFDADLNSFLTNKILKLYVSYGMHQSMLMLENRELLWCNLDLGVYYGLGTKIKLKEKLELDFGLDAKLDFFNLNITDINFDDAFYEEFSERNNFWGYGASVHLVFIYKYN